jgi:DNA-3-methyladenine glycosylase II
VLLDNNYSPEQILATDDEKFREAGLSQAKIKYFKGVSEAKENGQIQERKIRKMSDEEVVAELTALKGIGRWSVEMILIFTLGREDIFSLGDLGLRTAVSRLYSVDREDLRKIEEISLVWSPHRSLASRYLWKSLDAGLTKSTH